MRWQLIYVLAHIGMYWVLSSYTWFQVVSPAHLRHWSCFSYSLDKMYFKTQVKCTSEFLGADKFLKDSYTSVWYATTGGVTEAAYNFCDEMCY